MRQAIYEQLPDDPLYHGRITGLDQVHACGATQVACRMELRTVLERWLLLRLCRQLSVPSIARVPLTRWIQCYESIGG
jgi:hypothetical protein